MSLIKKVPEIFKFKQAVNKRISINKNVLKTINEKYFYLKNFFKNENLFLKKIGEYAYNTVDEFNDNINLDLALVGYFSSKAKNTFDKIKNKVKKILNLIDKNILITIPDHEMYIKLSFTLGNKKIFFRIILLANKKVNNSFVSFINRNGISQEDGVLEITKAWIYANKLSSGLLNSLKKLIKFILKDDFKYYYFLDMLILRWWNELLSTKLNKYIKNNLFSTSKNEWKNIDINKYFDDKKIISWIKKNLYYKETITYILSRIWMTNTYYFKEFIFQSEEMFEGISRYSLFSNAMFELPINWFEKIIFCDLKNYDMMYQYQNNISNENGYSKIIFDNSRDNEYRYFASPVIRTIPVAFPLYRKWFTNKAADLYKMLPQDILINVKTTKQREALEGLNKIAHDWITILKNKINYLTPYFDKKYPMILINSPDELVSAIINMASKISDSDFLIGYDN